MAITSWVELTPAYGRDYKNQKDLLADWKANKDFRVASTGQYTSRREMAERFPNAGIILRYSNSEKVMDATGK